MKTGSTSKTQIETIQQALNAAMMYLHRNQLDYGEFRTYAAGNAAMDHDVYFDSSPFTTSLVLYSLSFLPDLRVQEMTARGLVFLQSEMEGQGVWRYWSSRNALHDVLPPDLDDTACISFILKQHQLAPANHEMILANRNHAGLFYTWLAPRETMPRKLKSEIRRMTQASALPFFSINGTREDVDYAVNANVLLYLREREETEAAIKHLIDLVSKPSFPGTSYYFDSFALYYFLSRAYFHGVASLAEARQAVLNSIFSRIAQNGSFGNELLTALAVCTCLNFGEFPDQLQDSVEYLVRIQSEDGCWARIPVWLDSAHYYGSQELTTALCIEALARSIL